MEIKVMAELKNLHYDKGQGLHPTNKKKETSGDKCLQDMPKIKMPLTFHKAERN